MTVTVTNRPDRAADGRLTAPAAGATVAGTITVTATRVRQRRRRRRAVQARRREPRRGGHQRALLGHLEHDRRRRNGAHTLTAVARDAAGNTTTSPRVTVTVSNATRRRRRSSLTAPANGATVSGTVTVTRNASDNVGVVGVQFKLDGANLGSEDTTRPTRHLEHDARPPTARTR